MALSIGREEVLSGETPRILAGAWVSGLSFRLQSPLKIAISSIPALTEFQDPNIQTLHSIFIQAFVLTGATSAIGAGRKASLPDGLQ